MPDHGIAGRQQILSGDRANFTSRDRHDLFTTFHSDRFYHWLAAAAIGASTLLVLASGELPEGLVRGELIVYGHGVIVAVVATAMLLRATYAVGFRTSPCKSRPRRPVTP